jgi:hypothetical protein
MQLKLTIDMPGTVCKPSTTTASHIPPYVALPHNPALGNCVDQNLVSPLETAQPAVRSPETVQPAKKGGHRERLHWENENGRVKLQSECALGSHDPCQINKDSDPAEKYRCLVVRVEAVEEQPGAGVHRPNPVIRVSCGDRTFEATLMQLKRSAGPAAATADQSENARDGRNRDESLYIFIPNGVELPEETLKRIGLWNHAKNRGVLSGRNGAEVAAQKVGKTRPDGILVALKRTGIDANVGDEVTTQLRAQIAPKLAPSAQLASGIKDEQGILGPFDFRAHDPRNPAFQPDEHVIVTEKVHGTQLLTCLYPPNPESSFKAPEGLAHPNACFSTKGLARKGCYSVMSLESEQEKLLKCRSVHNQHLRTLRNENLYEKCDFMAEDLYGKNRTVAIIFVFEAYGGNIQKNMDYDLKDPKALGLEIIVVTEDRKWTFLDYDVVKQVFQKVGISTPTVLYDGPYGNVEKRLGELASGPESISGKGVHGREGIVTRLKKPDKNGRVAIKKIVSEEFLHRKEKGETSDYS